MTTTHVLVPLAGALAFADRPANWRLIFAALTAAALPDVDFVLSPTSVFGHRGATHSFVVAVAAGLVAAIFHKRLRTSATLAGVVVTASMASHIILDMMSDYGLPVACLWPLSSQRLSADWRPFHTVYVGRPHLFLAALKRQAWEALQIILPLFGIALIVRWARSQRSSNGERVSSQ